MTIRKGEGQAADSAVHIDIEQRRIMLIGEISEIAAMQVVQGFVSMNDAKKRRTVPIEFWINSDGGSTLAASAICDAMHYVVEADVVTVGMGLICSAAVLPLLFGDARLVMPNADLLIHGSARDLPSSGGRFDAVMYDRYTRMIEQSRRSVAACDERLIRALIENAGWESQRAAATVGDGIEHWFFGGDTIVANGLADATYNRQGGNTE